MAGWPVLALALSILAAAFSAPPAQAAEPSPTRAPDEAAAADILLQPPEDPATWQLRSYTYAAANLTFHTDLTLLRVTGTADAPALEAWVVLTNGTNSAPHVRVSTLLPAGARAALGPPPGMPAPSPAPPAPSFAPYDDVPRPAPAPPAWTAPREPLALRPLGLLRALLDLLRALLELLRAAGLLALLYHRVTRDEALDHPLRARLLDELQRRPGLHVASLAQAVGAHPKTVAYHLRVLARVGGVRLEPEGRTLRAWPAAAAPGAPPDTSATRERALEILREVEGLGRAALAERLGITPQAASYHLKILHRQGRVRVRWLGRERRFDAA